MHSSQDLEGILLNLDGKGYPAYKSLKGEYNFDSYIFSIDSVQSDPFAPPSRVHITINRELSQFPLELSDSEWKRIALEDYLLRSFFQNSQSETQDIIITKCGQEILYRNCVEISPESITVRFRIRFPGAGRRILAKSLYQIIFNHLSRIIKQTLYYSSHNINQLHSFINLADDQHFLREQILEDNLVAFIANGSNLPRENGKSDLPLSIQKTVLFHSPPSLEITFTLPHSGPIVGMGIPSGITLIAGGGFHGKSTLLRALEKGIYNHIPGDGREFVVTNPTAVKIRSEDGRSIVKNDISPFICNLPSIPSSNADIHNNNINNNNKTIYRDTQSFSTECASGSTSQAANIVEAIESGSQLLLIDEDTSATNFMIRDLVMSKIIGEKEPITPFTDLIQPLYEIYGISTILIVGSSGSYVPLSNLVIQMDAYSPIDITERSKEIFNEVFPEFPIIQQNNQKQYENGLWKQESKRILEKGLISHDSNHNFSKIKVVGLDSLLINNMLIDVRYIEQLTDETQIKAAGYILDYIDQNLAGKNLSVSQIGDIIMNDIHTKGLSFFTQRNNYVDSIAFIRKQDLLACLNRMRTLKITQVFK